METTSLLTRAPTPEDTDKTMEFPNDYSIDIQSSYASKLHSCSSYRFFRNLTLTTDTYNDILNLISKYYTPKQTVVEENSRVVIDSSTPSKVRCKKIRIPSCNISSNDETKSYSLLCPFFFKQLIFEFFFWLVLINILIEMDWFANWISFIALFTLYALIQTMIWWPWISTSCCSYKDGFYRYKHIFCVPLYDINKRINYFNKIFDNAPTITAQLFFEATDFGWDNIKKELSVYECATFIEPNISLPEDDDNNDEYINNWFYCIAYETDIDFIDKENRAKFEQLCIDFINENLNAYEDYPYHSFSLKVTQELVEGHRINKKKYLSGHIMILNCADVSVDIFRFVIKLLNVLCLSLLYKIPLFFVEPKRIKIIKYIGFGA